MPCFGKQQCGQVCQNGNIQAETCGSNAIQYYNDMNNQCNSGQSGTTCFARRSPLFMNQCNECQKNDCFANTANTALDECCNKQDQVQQCNTCECTYDNIGNPGASCGLPVFMPPCGCAPMTPSVESKKCCESNNYEAAHCDNDACQFCSDESNEAQCGKQQQGSFNIITRRKRSPLVISNCAECQNEYAQSGSNNQAYSKCDDCQNQVSCCEDHQEEYTKIQK
ncbi:hypothetical protein G9A89_016887 [Geosiphon pyriformis]|nr:hypothetical protein G9A89_016887 [Geosiphon pyriformis]